MEKVDRVEAMKTGDLADTWLMIYVHLAKPLIENKGVDGEYILRESLRSFGTDRGSTLRREQEQLGMKINMYNLWTYYDLPDDPRFRRNKIRLNEEERISQTLVCPMFNLWQKMDAKELGAIYCDEFHPAMFSAYNEKIVTNLGETLTHDTDDHCHFALYLRPANMNKEERKHAFAKFDDDYDPKLAGEYVTRTPKEGYKMLLIKLYSHMADQIIEEFGDDGLELVTSGLDQYTTDVINFLKERASQLGENYDEQFIEEHYPASLEMSRDPLWNDYKDFRGYHLFRDHVLTVIKDSINHEN